MKYYFIVNARAGNGKDADFFAKQIEEVKNDFDIEVYYTVSKEDASKTINDICEKNPDEKCFVACGGDGTINHVVSSIYGRSNTYFSVCPLGSGNDFVKCFEKDSFRNIKNILNGTLMDIDLVKANDRLCVNIANFGFDTVVAQTVNDAREKKGHAGKAYYTKGIIKALVSAMRNEAKVYANGELLNENGEYLLCTIGNGQYVGGSFNCSPRAMLNDGMLEVCLVKCISRLKFVTMIGNYTNGTHLDDKNCMKIMVYRRVNNIKVVAPKGLTYTLDGEIMNTTELNISVIPHAIKLITPGKPLYEEK